MRLYKIIALVVVVFIIYFLGGCGKKQPVTEDSNSPADNEPVLIEEEPPAPPAVEKLDGTYIVVVENSPMARPQAGINEADIVYEILAEGGITRFTAIYRTYDIEKIGPIRSTRVDLVELAHAYGSPYVHVGGHHVALDLAVKLKLQTINEMHGNMSAYFWRSRDRKMPHNLYTSGENIQKAIDARAFKLGLRDSFKLGSMTGGDPAREITIRYYEKVTFKYENGLYKRYINGKEHLLEGGQSIAPANLVIILADHRPYAQGDDRVKISLAGTGKAYFFINGIVHEGKWERPAVNNLFAFSTIDGNEILFTEGQIWISIVPTEKGRLEWTESP